MAKFLVDTHVLLWFQAADERLSSEAISIISASENTIYFSQISLFEIAIKQKIGKLPEVTASLSEIYQQAISDSFSELILENLHISYYEKVPLFQDHRDPFDRILIAQTMFEDIPFITIDPKFNLYSDIINVIW